MSVVRGEDGDGEMSKYIDADKVIDYANQEVSSPFFSIERDGAEDVATYKNKWAFVKQVMVGMPAADVVEVRHGRWIYLSGLDAFECSVCGTQMVRNIFDYCPWCGSRMDLEGEEE